jgi:hypothetical protein
MMTVQESTAGAAKDSSAAIRSAALYRTAAFEVDNPHLVLNFKSSNRAPAAPADDAPNGHVSTRTPCKNTPPAPRDATLLEISTVASVQEELA